MTMNVPGLFFVLVSFSDFMRHLLLLCVRLCSSIRRNDTQGSLSLAYLAWTPLACFGMLCLFIAMTLISFLRIDTYRFEDIAWTVVLETLHCINVPKGG